jgi:hypothetical protein
MKKILVAVLVAAVFVVVANAEINLLWYGLGGFNMPVSEGQGPILSPFPGQSALVQLIFTTDNFIMDATPSAGVLGNETVIDEFWVASSQYASVEARNYNAPFQAGYIYARIFAGVDDAPDKGDIGFNHWYYAGPVVATIDNLTPDTPDEYDMNRGLSSTGFGDDLDLQVIPEPSVMALAALGGLVLLIRRRFAL